MECKGVQQMKKQQLLKLIDSMTENQITYVLTFLSKLFVVRH